MKPQLKIEIEKVDPKSSDELYKIIDLTNDEVKKIENYPHWDVMMEIIGDQVKENKILFMWVHIPFGEGKKRLYSVDKLNKLSDGPTTLSYTY